LPDAGADVAHNRGLWTIVNAEFTDEHALRAWAADEVTWGLFQIPERELGVLGDVGGLDVLELGCGTAYLSGLLARQGARPVGVDLTPGQLATAGRCQERFGLVFPLVEGNAEHVPLADAGFDLVVSEYGASVWCDPERWVAEAARLLRPANGRSKTSGLRASPADSHRHTSSVRRQVDGDAPRPGLVATDSPAHRRREPRQA
jgi:SAM-dependent methyltransferase